ncbi:MAG: isopenicillin N synthase family oxygenase [Elainella sp. Prado103]|jgi:isopenicillin N synthase-like dioxygenase|nr:isopenicillin N synthase family oxygenase [Elainella sp. Prado103]
MASTAEPLPVLSGLPLYSADLAAKQRLAQQVKQACETFGFFYLQDLPVTATQVQAIFRQTQRFFQLPEQTKLQLLRDPTTNCGYVPIETEHLDNHRPADLKEALNIGQATDWSTGLASFRIPIDPFYQVCLQQIAYPLLQAFALALELPPSFLVDRHGQNFFLRLLHYPALAKPALTDQLRAGAHTDYGTMTLLFQDSAGGLEILTRAGVWLPVPSRSNAVLVNIGDALQRWSNQRLRSTPHRVVLPPYPEQERYSIALFCDPDPEVEIACLPNCQSPDDPPKYPPIRFKEYLQSRFDASYHSNTTD